MRGMAEREREPTAKRPRVTVLVGGGGGGEASAGCRKLRQTMLVVLFLMSVKTVTVSLSKISRMVQRKVDSTISRLQNDHEHVTAKGSNTNFRLRFMNGLKTPVYTCKNLTAEDNSSIKIGIYDGDGKVTTGPLSKLRVEIVVLRGDFFKDCQESWTEQEFNNHIAHGRNGQGSILWGDHVVRLKNGEASLQSIQFTEGSNRGKLSIGARVSKSEKIGGSVQEAVMKPVVVQDRRNEANEKRHPPKLDDEVYRLMGICRNGIYHKRLQEEGIRTVCDFLTAMNNDGNKLREVLQIKKTDDSNWEKMVKHAKECCLEERHELKAYENEGGTMATGNKLKRARDQLDGPFDHIFANASAGAGPSLIMSTASQPDHSADPTAHQDGSIEAVVGLSYAQIESTLANANNDPCTFIPDHRVAQNCQDQGGTALPSGQQQFSLASFNCHQYPFGLLNPSDGNAGIVMDPCLAQGFYSGAADDQTMLMPNSLALDHQQSCPVAAVFDQQLEHQRQQRSLHLQGNGIPSTYTAHSSVALPPDQPAFGGSAQVSMQSQTQAQNQSDLALRQWPQLP